jgi:AcrR family transcriptional regulator
MQGRPLVTPAAPAGEATRDAARSDAGEGHRLRLIAAMASLLAERGYSTVTIADIARQAHVSKRTFYEHFADKDACFIACYEALSGVTLQAVVDAMADAQKGSWARRISAATRAYLATLESQPALTRTLMMDIYAAGPEALRVRRTVQKRFADNLRGLVDQGRKENPKLPRLSAAMATAIIGGINELVLVAVEEGRADRLTELSGTADALLQAVIGS